jgi:hypothetical protein
MPIVKELGSSRYLRYNRAKLVNFLEHSRNIQFDVQAIIESKDFRAADRMLKNKLPSYYASRHDRFISLAEHFNGSSIIELSKQVTEARRSPKVKPASWFKTEDAYDIISMLKHEYGISKVLDPFHGWGARALGAKMVGVDYVGIDLNPLLHHELLELFGPNIFCEDAFQFDYSRAEFDSVFTCPPYWRCEDYGYRVKYPQRYSKFVDNLCDLFFGFSGRVKVQAVSLEAFSFGGRRYLLDQDFVSGMVDRGAAVQEYVYRYMKRSFHKDERELKVFIITS